MPSALSTAHIVGDDVTSSTSEGLEVSFASLELTQPKVIDEQKSSTSTLRTALRTHNAAAILPALLPLKPEPPVQSFSFDPFCSGALRNLQFELQDEGLAGSFPGITASPIDYANIHHWKGVMTGPVGSPYEHGIYRLNIRLVEGYPCTLPEVQFETMIYHPNISIDGDLTKSFMARSWNRGYTIRSFLFFLRYVLANPYLDCDSDIANMESAVLFKVDRKACFVRAKEWTREFAI